MIRRLAASSVLALAAGAALAQDAPTIDVIHWRTVGAESATLQVLADEVEARGGVWVDSAAPGGGGDARTLLMSRVAGCDPPRASFLALGPEAIELGEGRAAMQVMGSWASAELENMGLAQDTDWDCALAPGSDAVVVEERVSCSPLSSLRPRRRARLSSSRC